MKKRLVILFIASLSLVVASGRMISASEEQSLLVVVGAAGAEEYGRQFDAWANRLELAATSSQAKFQRIGGTKPGPVSDKELLQEALGKMSEDNVNFVWIILIGHGTFDGKTAKFNLNGPDVTAEELAGWVAPLPQQLAIINCASASGPFLRPLSAPNRVVITSTKSGFEYNFSRFGDYFSQALADDAADLDKDGQTSLLEAWLSAAKQVAEFYRQDSRLLTENTLLDDNGDGAGTPADWFRGARVVNEAAKGAVPDGSLARQFVLSPSGIEAQLSAEARSRREELERDIEALRARKGEMPEAEYFAQLEKLLVPLARLYEQADSDDSAKKSAAAY